MPAGNQPLPSRLALASATLVRKASWASDVSTNLVRSASRMSVTMVEDAAAAADAVDEVSGGVESANDGGTDAHAAPARSSSVRWRAAGRSVLTAVRFSRIARQSRVEEEVEEDGEGADESEDDNDGFYSENEADWRGEEHVVRPFILPRVKVICFAIFDTAFTAMLQAIQQIPTMTLSLPPKVAHAYEMKSLSPPHAWLGAWQHLRTVGFSGLFCAFKPFALADIVGRVSAAAPRILYEAYTDSTVTPAQAQLMKVFGTFVGLIPQMVLEIVWARMAVVGGAKYASLGVGLRTVLAGPWVTNIALFGVPWYSVLIHFGASISTANRKLSMVFAYMPEGHPICAPRTFKEAVARTAREWRSSYSIKAVCKAVCRVMPATALGTCVGTCLFLPLFGSYTVWKMRIKSRLFTYEEQGLEQKLKRAADHVEGLRGRINVVSMRRAKPRTKLVRTATAVIKTEVAKGLSQKQDKLEKRLRAHCTKALSGGLTFNVPTINVKRQDPLASLQSVATCVSLALASGRVRIRYLGESGVDLGGMRRDYLDAVAKAISQSDLFEAGPDGGLLPKRQTEAQGSWRNQLFAVGRLLGLAIGSKTPLDVGFSRCLYKLLLDEKITAADLARIDPDFYKHRVAALLRPGGVAATEAALGDKLTFVGATLDTSAKEDELVEGGRNMQVTEENKESYVELLVEHYLLGRCRSELAVFVSGFHDVVPPKVLHSKVQDDRLRAIELELIVAGLPCINMDDWREHTLHEKPEKFAQLYSSFWEVIASMDTVDRAKVISFTCGSGRLPVGGFAAMKPQFNIRVSTVESTEHWPSSHTCFNQLCLPLYTSKEQLEERLRHAIDSTAGFGFL
eukprot:TRINITY_DN747_c0_g2_i1.p1 TRINITY_DN747_c0_g2~~TRINITY_DN747_c0_g2_i1.p1  ORF type:complete len:873 (-),score=136.68 TRINITY_DN747_c0_g2_i1:63-2615(-)